MHKIILIIVLAVVSSSAVAEWLKVDEGGSGISEYVNPDTILKSGSKATLWILCIF